MNQIIVSCPNKKYHGDANGICEVVLTYADMLVHLEMKCPMRIVKCSEDDCAYYDFARNIAAHESTCVIKQHKEWQRQSEHANCSDFN